MKKERYWRIGREGGGTVSAHFKDKSQALRYAKKLYQTSPKLRDGSKELFYVFPEKRKKLPKRFLARYKLDYNREFKKRVAKHKSGR